MRTQVEVLQELVVGLLGRLALSPGCWAESFIFCMFSRNFSGFLLGPTETVQQRGLFLGQLVLEMLQSQIDLLLGEIEIGRVGLALGLGGGGRVSRVVGPDCRRAGGPEPWLARLLGRLARRGRRRWTCS